MITVKDVLSYLEAIAPTDLKMDWDNIGLLCGKSSQPVHKILVALDPFLSVCKEAADLGADLIVTHHPLIFGSIQSVTDETSTGQAILFLASHNISAINAHTNLDCAPGGVNDVLAETLGLSDIQVIEPGLLRQGTIAEQPLETFLAFVRDRLTCPGLRYVSGNTPVHKVAVGGGSCASELPDVASAGCDTFVTADVKYNQFWDAKELGINLIDAGHFYTENPICKVLQEKLQAKFPELQVITSKTHTDCANFFL